MWTEFVRGLGGRFAERWVAVIITPAALFWAGGLAALYWHADTAWWRWGLATLVSDHAGWIDVQLPDPVELGTPALVAIGIGALFLVAASAAVAQQFVLQVLRWAEGYWPGWLGLLRTRLERRRLRQKRMIKSDRAELAGRFSRLSRPELTRYSLLDVALTRFPENDYIMPTKLGNILRAAETRPEQKYGLNVIICWPRLWLLLPETVRKELGEARAGLDAATLAFVWSLLFVIWGVWLWWAIPVGLLAAYFSYQRMLSMSEGYGDLLESVYDVYRPALYKALRWPMPKNPIEEVHAGQAITKYLWRTRRREFPTFTGRGSEADTETQQPAAAATVSNNLESPAQVPKHQRSTAVDSQTSE
jgi:hypothetical protein